ncbi:MAG: hypothetical protein IKK40_08820 [Bacteroidales bacterium]|nr:hypothetical protein [Clostridia bacterium]MBR4116100.1 hypothetical protein [Bacteroidales bacterium]
MRKEIEIGGNNYEFVANAATPIYYKQFFNKDLLASLTSGEGLQIASDALPELAFIMAKQADKADMMNLKYKHYIEWLERFDALDIPLHAEEIISVYYNNVETSVEPKKKGKGARNA